MLNKR